MCTQNIQFIVKIVDRCWKNVNKYKSQRILVKKYVKTESPQIKMVGKQRKTKKSGETQSEENLLKQRIEIEEKRKSQLKSFKTKDNRKETHRKENKELYFLLWIGQPQFCVRIY